MALPSLDDITLPLLRVLGDGAAWRVREASKRLESDFGLTEEDLRETVAGGEQKFLDRVWWARTHLVKADLAQIYGARDEPEPPPVPSQDVSPLEQIEQVLIHGEQLADLMIEYQVGVSVEHHFRVCRLDADYFQDLE